MRSLQSAGLSVATTKRISREIPTASAPPLSPPLSPYATCPSLLSLQMMSPPTTAPSSFSQSLGSPTAAAPSPHALVPTSSFGPPSPSSSTSSSPSSPSSSRPSRPSRSARTRSVWRAASRPARRASCTVRSHTRHVRTRLSLLVRLFVVGSRLPPIRHLSCTPLSITSVVLPRSTVFVLIACGFSCCDISY